MLDDLTAAIDDVATDLPAAIASELRDVLVRLDAGVLLAGDPTRPAAVLVAPIGSSGEIQQAGAFVRGELIGIAEAPDGEY